MTATETDPTDGPDVAQAEGIGGQSKSFGRQTMENFLRHKLALAGLVIFVMIVVVTFLAPRLTSYSYDEINAADRAQGPSVDHLFGTDELGRDLWVRIWDGTYQSLRIALVVALVSTGIGGFLGAMAGYFGRWTDVLVTQLINLLLVVPGIVVLAVAGIKWGSKPFTMGVLLACLLWIRIARVVRAQFLSLKESEYVQAARALGAGSPRIIVRHLLPAVMGPMLVEVTLVASLAIGLEATLSFLGLGVQPPVPTLGNIINEFKGALDSRPSRVLIPGGILVTIALSLNFIGDGLRDALDPKSKKVRA